MLCFQLNDNWKGCAQFGWIRCACWAWVMDDLRNIWPCSGSGAGVGTVTMLLNADHKPDLINLIFFGWICAEGEDANDARRFHNNSNNRSAQLKKAGDDWKQTTQTNHIFIRRTRILEAHVRWWTLTRLGSDDARWKLCSCIRIWVDKTQPDHYFGQVMTHLNDNSRQCLAHLCPF